jgi:hypothetical protein
MKKVFRARFEKKRDELNAWLPKRLFDIHTHVGLPEHHEPLTPKRKARFSVGYSYEQSHEGLQMAYANLFPGKEVESVGFPFPFRETHLREANRYALKGENPFILADLNDLEYTKRLVRDRRVKGVKSYYDQLGKLQEKTGCWEFTPDELMKEINAQGKVLMLHVPKESIADEENIARIEELAKRFPKMKIILAHMGRAFKGGELENVIPRIKPYKNIYLETSANSTAATMKTALKELGSKRVLFGTDAPYAFLLGSVEETPWGGRTMTLDKHKWTSPKDRRWMKEHGIGKRYTFLAYHSISAIKEAFEDLGLKRSDKENVFWRNAKRLLT